MRNVTSLMRTKRVIAYLLAILMVVSLLPLSAFVTTAAPAPDGTFESGTVGELPAGWRLVSTSMLGNHDSAGTYLKNYSLTVTDGGYKSSKAMCIKSTDAAYNYAINGYVVAESPAISVVGGKGYSFNYAMKIEGAEETDEKEILLGGWIFIAQYDKDGKEISRVRKNTLSRNKNMDWTYFSNYIETVQGAASVKIEYYLGGKIHRNPGIKLYVDNFEFSEFATDKLLNGDFEQGETDLDIYSWHLSSKDIYGNPTTADYLPAYTFKRVDGLHGDAVQVARTTWGYVSLDSNMIKVKKNATYIIDYAYKLENCGEGTEGMGAGVVEYDKNFNRLKRTNVTRIKTNTGWTTNSLSITPEEGTAYIQLEFFIGGYTEHNKITASFDDIKVNEFVRETKPDAINNSGFEGVFGNTIFDWELVPRDHGKIVSTFEGYNGTKGIKVSRNDTAHNYAVVKSNFFTVKAGADYKLTYMAHFNRERVGNCYSVANVLFYDKDGKQIENGRVQTYDFDWRYVSENWENIEGYYTAPEGAVKCRIEFIIAGTKFDFYMDDVVWSEVDQTLNYDGFEHTDENGNILGWTPSHPTAVKVDKNTYAEGKQSLFISHTANDQYTEIMSDKLIVAERETRYKFTIKVKSFNTDVNSEGIRLSAKIYGHNGKLLTEVLGLRYTLNEDTNPSEWKELILGVNTSLNIGYIRVFVEVAPGTMNLWIDDLRCEVYDRNNEFWDDFTSATNNGNPVGWDENTVDGEPEFEVSDGKAIIHAESSSDEGFFSTRWNTALEFKPFTLHLRYAASGGAEAVARIRFFDSSDREITADGYEVTFDSTNGELVDETFDFYLNHAKYAIVELGNDGRGQVAFDGVAIVGREEEKANDNTDWRAYWVWHAEDYLESENSTPRYFRYHLNITGTPINSNIQITADDNLELYVNGVDYSDEQMKEHWGNISIIDNIHESLHEGENIIAVSVVNFTSYAGLIFDGFVETEEGDWIDFYTNVDSTISSLEEKEGWTEVDFDDSDWTKVIKVEDVGGGQWDVIPFDCSPYVEEGFEIKDYQFPEQVVAGVEDIFTMTIVPDMDFTKDEDLSVSFWVRNTQNVVYTCKMKQISGPSMKDWREGEEITVQYAFEIPDYIGTGKYTLQFDINQVRVTNDDLMNNKLTKALNLLNTLPKNPIKSEMKEINGTQALVINGDVFPNMTFVNASENVANPYSRNDEVMHGAGICIARHWTSTTRYWTDYDEYDFETLDKNTYTLLASHPDEYLILTIGFDAPQWWIDENPDHCVTDNEGKISGPSMASKKAYEDLTKAASDLLAHMMEQPYWNRVVALVPTGFTTAEWIWYGSGQTTVDYSAGALEIWREWLEKKYGTDQELRKAWGQNGASIKNAHVPTFDESKGDKYPTLLSPETQQDILDYNEFLHDTNAEWLMAACKIVTDMTDDSLIVGTYYGYMMNRVYFWNASRQLHLSLEKVLDCENIDFIAAPCMYGERYDGEPAGFMHMIDSVLSHGKGIIVEDDLRLCSFDSLARNFFTRDEVGPTYTVNDSVSQIQHYFANEITSNIGQWYHNLSGTWFEREQFSEVLEISYNEAVVNLARDKNCTGEVAFILDEDMYDNLAAGDFYSNYNLLYPMVIEQRFELAKAGVAYDTYLMSDLEKGLIPDHKVYIMFAPVEIDEAEEAAVNKYLKNNGKTVLWLYLAGASDNKTFSAANMSEIIGMDVKLNAEKTNISATVYNKDHWLTEGIKGKFYGDTSSRDSVSPTAIVTDTSATILAGMTNNSKDGAIAVKEFDEWTSVFSAVPAVGVDMIRNIYKHAGVHIYSENNNDIIYNNSNYVGINTAFGGQKTIKLPGNYAVYDIYAQKTISLDTNVIEFEMYDNSTKLFRLTPVGKHVVYVDVRNSMGDCELKGYNEVMPDDDFSCEIVAKEGYVITEIIIDGVKTEMREASYSIDLDDLDNSHFIKANFKKASAVDALFDNGESSGWIIWAALGAVVLAAAAVIFFIILKKKNKKEETAE